MDNQIFVKIEEYNEVLDIVKLVREKIVKAEDVIGKINELRAEEEHEVELWSKNLQNISKKVEHMEKQLSETNKA